MLGLAAYGGGLACVSNLGSWANWTGHVFAASNVYGCGRLGWDTALDSATVHREWAAMTFPEAPRAVAEAAVGLLEGSWSVYVSAPGGVFGSTLCHGRSKLDAAVGSVAW